MIHNRPLRRRTFLATASALAVAGCGTTASDPVESPTPREIPSPREIPTSAQIPTRFTARSSWPRGQEKASSRITALSGRHLTATAPVDEARDLFAGGQVPVIVDVATDTTRAVLVDANGAWITKQVTVGGEHRAREPRTELTALLPGPAVIDGEHAYICVGVDAPAPEATSTPSAHIPESDKDWPVVLLKIRLTDGAVVGSLTVHDHYPEKDLAENLHLSLSPDRASLLLAGSGRRGLVHGRPKWIGMRINASDLTVEFEPRHLVHLQEVEEVTAAGQGIVVSSSEPSRLEVLSLVTGHRHTIVNHENTRFEITAALVVGDWAYLRQVTHGESGEQHSRYVIDLASGESGELPGTDFDVPRWPVVSSDQRLLIGLGRRKLLSVWEPGEAEPRYRWQDHVDLAPWAAASLQDHVYIRFQDPLPGRLEIRQVGSAEPVANTEEPYPDAYEVQAVSRWGLATRSNFFLATHWLDTPEEPTPSPTAAPS
ncbi:hypothetical protein [Arachnia propionica]|uniref:Lipoprotein n=1 Tax=Arachnia propionica TaxID=1750 RepID=A0A3P1WNR1_9ACTN|nr:hypothetical protein [Arachnia propionica]RRD48279.1 hypothetical protein EII35_13615 [Arachnia propionica]